MDICRRWKTIPARKDTHLRPTNLKKIFSALERLGRPKQNPSFEKTNRWALKINRKLEQTEKLLELFYPFIHDYRHIFQTNSLFLYDVREKEFEFSIRQIDWASYWKNVQMPGLRKWCFPVIEGKAGRKICTTAHPFSFSRPKHSMEIHAPNPNRKPRPETLPILPPGDFCRISEKGAE